MEIPPCWGSLSEEERVDCIGDLRDFPCCSRFAWNVKGRLQSDWNHRVQHQISGLIRHNHKQVFGKSGVQVPWSLQLYLLSSTNDPSTAIPTVFILTADKKTASRMRKLITRHDVFKNLNTGFDVLYEGKSIFMRAGDTNVSGYPWSAESISLCGAPVVITADPTQLNGRWRRATIFCVVKIHQQHFAVLPAHVFDADDRQDAPLSDLRTVQTLSTDSPTSSDSENSDCSSEHSVDRGSDDSGYQGSDETTSHRIEPLMFDVPSKHAVYLRAPGSSANNSTLGDFNLIGYCDPKQQFNLCGLAYEATHEHDYALVKLDSLDWIKPNRISISTSEHLKTEKYMTKPPCGRVLIATGSCGIQQVCISGTAATMMLPGTQRPQTVWEVEYALGQGDSGSLVLDLSGQIVGMAIATIPNYNITYIIPAPTIFETIYASMNTLEAGQHLDPSIVSQTCLKLTSITSGQPQSLSKKDIDLPDYFHSKSRTLLSDSSLRRRESLHSTSEDSDYQSCGEIWDRDSDYYSCCESWDEDSDYRSFDGIYTESSSYMKTTTGTGAESWPISNGHEQLRIGQETQNKIEDEYIDQEGQTHMRHGIDTRHVSIPTFKPLDGYGSDDQTLVSQRRDRWSSNKSTTSSFATNDQLAGDSKRKPHLIDGLSSRKGTAFGHGSLGRASELAKLYWEAREHGRESELDGDVKRSVFVIGQMEKEESRHTERLKGRLKAMERQTRKLKKQIQGETDKRMEGGPLEAGQGLIERSANSPRKVRNVGNEVQRPREMHRDATEKERQKQMLVKKERQRQILMEKELQIYREEAEKANKGRRRRQ